MASQVERVFYGSNQVPGQQLSREDIKQLRFRIKRDDGTIDNVVFDPLVGQDLYMACLKFFKNYSHGSNPTEVGHYEAGEAGANGNDFDVEINNQEIFLFREDDLVLTDSEFDRLNADLAGWTPVALRSTSSDDVQHQWLYLSRSPDTGIRFICIEDTKARIAVIAPDSPHNIAISDAFDTSLFELKSNKTSYIDPTINQSGKYLGGSAVNGFVEKRTFAISIPYGATNSNTFTKILEFDETFDGSRTRGSIFARLKIQFVGTSIRRRLREIDAYIGYELNSRKAFVTFGNCYNTITDNDLKKLHIVTYDTAARRHIEVYLEHRELTAMTNWISVEVCENFEILEQSWTLTQTSHSSWKIPLASYDWDEVNGASIQPTAAALPTTGVLKTDSYIVQSGNQAPFTYVPDDVVASTMPIAKLARYSGDTRKLVFKLYSSEGWVAIGKVERVNNSVFKLNFSAISDKPDFDNGVATPYIYLSLLDGVYFVNLKIDSYHTVAKSIAIEVENESKDWEFFGSTIPDSVGNIVSDTDTYMKADLTAEVIDQGTNVPAPTSSTKVLTKQTDANGREFWKTEQMSDMTAGYFNRGSGNTFDALSEAIRTGPSSNHGSFQLSTAYAFAGTTITLVSNQWYQYRWSRTANSTAYGELELCRVTGNNSGQLEKITVLYDNNAISAVYREVMASGGVGSSSIPVYANSGGSLVPCAGIGEEFWIDGTGGSAIYKTIGSIAFVSGTSFSQLCMEIGPIGTVWSADSQVSKVIVKLSCYSGSYKLNVLAINYPDLTSRCSFDTRKADGLVYIVVRIVPYGSGAHVKVVSHGTAAWTAGVSYSGSTPPDTMDGGAYVTYKYINAS